MEHSYKIAVSKISPKDDGVELFSYFVDDVSNIIFSYKQNRDRVLFTNKNLVLIDFTGWSEKEKEFVIIPYSSISAVSLKTAGIIKGDSDLILSVVDVGSVLIEFGKNIQTKEILAFLCRKIGRVEVRPSQP